MKKRKDIKTTIFEADYGFMVDIVDAKFWTNNEPFWDVYLYRKDYGVKMGMFGLPKNQTPTLEEAIAAANAGDTVKLLADIDFTVYPAFTRHTLDLTGVTLDLDGHTITGYNHSVVYVGDNFTIKNLKEC